MIDEIKEVESLIKEKHTLKIAQDNIEQLARNFGFEELPFTLQLSVNNMQTRVEAIEARLKELNFSKFNFLSQEQIESLISDIKEYFDFNLWGEMKDDPANGDFAGTAGTMHKTIGDIVHFIKNRKYPLK